MVTINGEKVPAQGLTIRDYLVQENYDLNRVIVEQNRKILSKGAWESTVIMEGDSIEILCLVGGG